MEYHTQFSTRVSQPFHYYNDWYFGLDNCCGTVPRPLSTWCQLRLSNSYVTLSNAIWEAGQLITSMKTRLLFPLAMWTVRLGLERGKKKDEISPYFDIFLWRKILNVFRGKSIHYTFIYKILTNPLLVIFGRGLLVLWPKFYTSGVEYTLGLSRDTDRNNSKPPQAKVAAHIFVLCSSYSSWETEAAARPWWVVVEVGPGSQRRDWKVRSGLSTQTNVRYTTEP